MMDDGIEAQVVNSNVSALIDCAWRWHWLVAVLAEQEILAGKAEVEAWRAAKGSSGRAVIPDFYEGCLKLSRMVLDDFRHRDPVAVDLERSFWAETVAVGL